MTVLLDECVPWPLSRLITGHPCTSVQKRGWGGIKNGKLLGLAEPEFDLLITCDQSIRFQQNLEMRTIAILALSTNDLRRIRAAAAEIIAALSEIESGEYRHLEIA